MGCSQSTGLEKVLRDRYPQTASVLQLDPAWPKLVAVFQWIDADNSGQISLVELLDYLQLDRTPFVLKAFLSFDDDNSGLLDFREFCFAVWNFCTLSKTDLVTFVHHIYSSSISNASASEALKAIVIDVYGKEKLKSVFLRDLLAKIEKISDPSLQREHFIRFVEKNGALLFPAWDVQRQMRDKVIGKSFWNKATKRREQSHNKLYRPTMFEQLYEMLVRTDGEHQRREEAGERQPKKKGKKAAAIQPMQILAVSG